jgi:hypothetical protein
MGKLDFQSCDAGTLTNERCWLLSSSLGGYLLDFGGLGHSPCRPNSSNPYFVMIGLGSMSVWQSLRATHECPCMFSRAMQVLSQMKDAGYSHRLWEDISSILAGWDKARPGLADSPCRPNSSNPYFVMIGLGSMSVWQSLVVRCRYSHK